MLGFEIDEAGWRYWEAFNLFKGACANLTADPRVRRRHEPGTRTCCSVGTALHQVFLRRLVDLIG